MALGGALPARPKALCRSTTARRAGLVAFFWALAGIWVAPAFTGGAAPRPPARGCVTTNAIPTLRPLKIQRQNRRLSDWKPQLGLPEPAVGPFPGEPMLPPMEDIYSRTFTGNATEDAIGGRRRYSAFIIFKDDPATRGPVEMEKKILPYISFMKYKLSCFKIQAKAMKSPIDGKGFVNLEWPMLEYGEVGPGQKKKVYNTATLFELSWIGPVQSPKILEKKIHEDNNILKVMTLRHTKKWQARGEDNELLL